MHDDKTPVIFITIGIICCAVSASMYTAGADNFVAILLAVTGIVLYGVAWDWLKNQNN